MTAPASPAAACAMPRRRLTRWLLSVLLGLLAPAAQALCLGPLCQCNVSASSVAFGSYQPLSMSHKDSTGTVQVSCGGVAGLLIPYRVDLGPGGGGIGNRRLSNGVSNLAYNLYRDAGRSVIWGDGSGGSQYATGGITLDILGWSAPHSFTVYGRIPGGQTLVTPGAYADTIGVTLTFF